MKDNRKNGLAVRLIAYFIYGSFLLPRGPMETIPVYKTIATICVWAATFLAVLFILSSVKKRRFFTKKDMLIFAYFIFLIVITFVDRIIVSGEFVTNGYQKIFAYPAIALFTIYMFRSNKKLLLNAIINISLAVNAVNILLPSALTQMTFIGHVQVVCQFCVVSLLCTVMHILLFKTHAKRNVLAILLSIITLSITDALTAKVIGGFCIFAYILYKIRDRRKSKRQRMNISPKAIVAFWVILNIGLIAYTLLVPFDLAPANFSGRTYIWQASMKKIAERPIFGYGIEGVLMKVFWSSWYGSDGFNYAHNQFLQNLMDGGVVCLVLFIMYFYGSIRNVNKIKNEKIRYLFVVIAISLAAIMLFESVSLYSYAFIALAIIYSYSTTRDYIYESDSHKMLRKK